MTAERLKDLRAPSLPNDPYSAYCKTCWYPVYTLWSDPEHHGSGCHSAHPTAAECPDAMGRAKFAADMQKARELHPVVFSRLSGAEGA